MNEGFSSLPYEDVQSRASYLSCLPMIAECLSKESFFIEFEKIITSIVKHTKLLQNFYGKLDELFLLMPHNDFIKLLYLCGSKICISSEDKPKLAFLNKADELMTKIGDYDLEIEHFIKPGLGNTASSKFAVYRLCRMSNFLKDNSKIVQLLFCEFSYPDRLLYSSEFFQFLNPIMSKDYIYNLLIHSNEDVRIAAIRYFETHEIASGDDFLERCLVNEKSPRVQKEILQLPPKFVSINVIKSIINSGFLVSDAIRFSFSSPHLSELIPLILEKEPSGIEINFVDFASIIAMNPIPYGLLSDLLKESKEFLLPKTVESIASLNETEVLNLIVFPRINECVQWRARYNAVLIFQQIAKKRTDDEFCPDYLGFIVPMAIDHVYMVRQIAFEVICGFKNVEMKELCFTQILLLSATKTVLNGHVKSVLKHLLIATKSTISQYDSLVPHIKLSLEKLGAASIDELEKQ